MSCPLGYKQANPTLFFADIEIAGGSDVQVLLLYSDAWNLDDACLSRCSRFNRRFTCSCFGASSPK